MRNMGYIVVRKPEFVGEHFGDVPRILGNTRQEQIRYSGICRDPWWDLNGLFYGNKLSRDEKALREKIIDTKTSFFYAGICEDLESARQALLLSNKERNVNEIVFVSINQAADAAAGLPFGTEFSGFDYYVDGYGSTIRLGIFTKPEAFLEVIGMLNSYGLFDSQVDLRNYLELYSERCEGENLEIINSEQMSGPSLLVYRL